MTPVEKNFVLKISLNQNQSFYKGLKMKPNCFKKLLGPKILEFKSNTGECRTEKKLYPDIFCITSFYEVNTLFLEVKHKMLDFLEQSAPIYFLLNFTLLRLVQSLCLCPFVASLATLK